MNNTTDLSAQLFVELQQLTGGISLFRSYSSMVGFIPKTHYTASHVEQKECYTAEQWLSDYFANKIGLIPSFLDMNQCVPQSPEAAAKTLGTFLSGLEALPQLKPREGGESLSLFDALRADISDASKSRKLMQGKTIYITEKQKEIGGNLIDQIALAYQNVCKSMQALKHSYENTKN